MKKLEVIKLIKEVFRGYKGTRDDHVLLERVLVYLNEKIANDDEPKVVEPEVVSE